MKEEFAQIATQFGTPTYVYDGEIIRRNAARLDAAMKGISHLICFAVKANPNLSVLSLLKDAGVGFDVVSEGELRRVLHIGADPSQVVFSGVGKSVEELMLAQKSGLRFLNLESESELTLLESVITSASRDAKPMQLSIRVNPDLVIESHPHLSTGHKESKFGVSLARAKAMAKRIKENAQLNLTSIHAHIGSNVSDPIVLGAAYRELVSFAQELREEGIATISELDLGGGFGIGYSGKYEPLDIEEWGAMVREIFAGTGFSIVVEPGKFLVAESGVLLTRVEHVKEDEDLTFAIVDAGMNDLARPALYDAYHRIDLVGAPRREGKPRTTDVVGPVCESGCFLGRGRQLPPLVRGDLLAVHDAGAYGFSMASNYNSRRLPAEVLCESGVAPRLVRTRQNWEALWADEL